MNDWLKNNPEINMLVAFFEEKMAVWDVLDEQREDRIERIITEALRQSIVPEIQGLVPKLVATMCANIATENALSIDGIFEDLTPERFGIPSYYHLRPFVAPVVIAELPDPFAKADRHTTDPAMQAGIQAIDAIRSRQGIFYLDGEL